MLMARVGGLERIGAGVDLQHQIDEVLQLHVVDARADVDAVAGVVADAIGRQAAQRVIEDFDAVRRPFAAGVDIRLRVHHVIRSQERVVDLEHEAGIDDRPVFLVQRLGERDEVVLVGLVVLVAVPVGEVRRRHRRHEPLSHIFPGHRRLEVVDVALQRGVPLYETGPLHTQRVRPATPAAPACDEAQA